MKNKPVSIENRWDILYRDYPEVYDEFASIPYDPPMVEAINTMFDFSGKKIVDIGSGSGLSTIPLAKYAEEVVGVEPEIGMRKIAESEAKQHGISNLEFVEGQAENMPFEDNHFDIVTAFFTTMYPPEQVVPLFISEALRVTKPGGLLLVVDVAPDWYGGELSEIIEDEDANVDSLRKHRLFVDDAGFSYKDIDHVQDYGSLDKIVSTYGFIFGRKAINHLRTHNITQINWRFRIYYKVIK